MGLEDKLEYGNHIIHTCPAYILWQQFLNSTAADTKVYRQSRRDKELRGDVGNRKVTISWETACSQDFRLLLQEILRRYAVLKIREHFWEEYSDAQKLQFYHDTPLAYRTTSGITVADMTEDVGHDVIELVYWRVKALEEMRKVHKLGCFVERGKIDKSIEKKIREKEGILIAKGFYL